ncbi:MAG: hypothetical protein J7623_19270 [Chitinophaga sp.]|uniref:beta strand repeat-containing protein n=1 Tax=Chitinophaga sp. TaxID=1869181 RepID=UPI001B1DF395|nr:hypothetical protein [Chitinophaga sp.]MBO9730789.1 hypothetical protein [Chitinophaga sp.]
MKLQGLMKVCAIILCCLCSNQLLAQQLKLGTNPSTLKSSALLELESAKQALLITRIADTNQIVSPVNGMIIYLTTDNSFRVRANNYWNKLIPEGSAIQSINNDATPAQKIIANYTPAGTFGFTTAAGTHTLTIPDAGLTAAGFMNIGAQSFKGLKNFTDGLQTANLRVVNDLSTPTKILGKDGSGDVSALTLDATTLNLTAGLLKANNTTKLWNAGKIADYDVSFATAPTTDQVLTFNGTQWIAKAAASAILSINSDATSAQKIVATYTPAGTFGFTTAAGTHTLTIPDAGLTAAGFMNIGAQSFKGLKNFTDGLQTANLRVVNDLSTPTKVLGKDGNGDVAALTLGTTLGLTAGSLNANNTTKLWNANKIADYDVSFATAPTTDQVLTFNGTQWIAKAATGGITSIGLSMPSLFTVTGSPLTANGTITTNLANQNANLVFAGPASGGAAAPTFRSLAAADIPTNLGGYIQNTTTQQASSNFNISGNGAIAGTLGVGTATPGNKVEITGPSFAPTSPFNISGLRLTNLVGALSTSIPATSKVLSINSSGDVILTDNPSTTNWLTGGNAATSTQFLGTTNAVDMVVKYNNKELFRGSRGQTAAESGGTDFSAYTLTLFNGATKFNGHPLIIRANGNDVLAFEDAAGTPKWHWNILGGGLNFVETNVADYRLFLQNGGNVGIGTSTPGALLDVEGTAIIGTGGSVLNGIIRATNVNPGSIATGTAVSKTFTVTGAAVGGNVIINPRADLTSSFSIVSARVSAANTVTVIFNNSTGSAVTNRSFDLTVIQ